MGGLYTMVGVCQLVAAVLLLIPATTLIGALIYLPVITGIVVVTWTLPFGNNAYITAMMVLGVVLLLCWDWPRPRHLVLPARRGFRGSSRPTVVVNSAHQRATAPVRGREVSTASTPGAIA